MTLQVIWYKKALFEKNFSKINQFEGGKILVDGLNALLQIIHLIK